MDFFEQQDSARRNTTYLIVLFAMAVIALTAVMYLPVYLVDFHITGGRFETEMVMVDGRYVATDVLDYFQWRLVGFAFLVTALVVGLGSYYKVSQLGAGGSSVALELGGVEVDARSEDPLRRRLYNVVEEMSLASGLAVPLVYVLPDEVGINAFAAGYTINDAAVAVTQGALEALTRDELQAVIAHEFSHILNGDMRLNIRLIGVVHGILLISIAGRGMLEMIWRGGNRRSSKNGGGAILLIGGVGLVLAIGGWLGVMFGRLIKSAVSRQREYLADAAAVQFTRNPAGLAGALKKIAAHQAGSGLFSPHAEEVSHMCFGPVSKRFTMTMTGWFESHPPLEERIRKWDPGYDASQLEAIQAQLERGQARAGLAMAGGGSGGAASAAASSGAMMMAAAWAGESSAVSGASLGTQSQGSGGGNDWSGQSRDLNYSVGAEEIVDLIGNPSPERLVYCSSLLGELPRAIMEARSDVMGASALVFALLMDDREEGRRPQIELLHAQTSEAMLREVRRLWEHVKGLDAEFRLPLVDLLFPTLRRMTPAQYGTFRELVGGLIYADDRVSLFEFVVQKVLMHRLEVALGRPGRRSTQFVAMRAMLPELQLLLSALAIMGHEHLSEARAAFDAGRSALPPAFMGDVQFIERPVNLQQVGAVLDRFAQASLQIKRHVINAAAFCVLGDGRVTVEEVEMLRAVCDVLDLPLPPLVPEATRRV
ncbi:M48 family metallopeptidase [Lujinxingia vulgaris]|uniref:M48 family metallopeptidase n=1 Tax=Lujinxingia vulgaris TaxID=2600176 RepID=A0A5C6XL55_9DELT|nr:M48 family metallopeptidase [Lujinxingia vulgaris]TXD38935.1 M48 family metallopeptidase [Lujinxingia vulgaris]